MVTRSLASRLVVAVLVALVSRPAPAQTTGAPPPPPQGPDTEPPPPPPDEETQADEEPPPEALPPQNPPDLPTFETQLAPYGRWVDTPGYGRVWVPNSTQRADWQ